SFCIKKDSEEYHSFCEFFENCAKFNKNSLLIDEKLDLENAPILFFERKNEGILLTFAVNYNIKKKEIWHLPKKNRSDLTNYYITFYKNLLAIKKSPVEDEPISEMAIS
ncbi:MAG: hypothetical protein PHX27_04615, partial [Candidatus ainarchaeum sp.]|nr:hypothetical protein [Candidatus ainarchaeum sp.]